MSDHAPLIGRLDAALNFLPHVHLVNDVFPRGLVGQTVNQLERSSFTPLTVFLLPAIHLLEFITNRAGVIADLRLSDDRGALRLRPSCEYGWERDAAVTIGLTTHAAPQRTSLYSAIVLGSANATDGCHSVSSLCFVIPINDVRKI
jgi:hypothetical protein